MKTHKPVIGRLIAVNKNHEPIHVLIGNSVYCLALRYSDLTATDLFDKLKVLDIRTLSNEDD